MTVSIQEALQEKTARASRASRRFDFEQEGSLATFWRQATPGTTYWRGYIPMKALPGQVQPITDDTLEWLDEEALTIRLNRQAGDTNIWQFLGEEGRTRIALQLQRQGFRTLMEVDDNYLRYTTPLYGKHGAWAKTAKDAEENGTGYSIETHRLQVPMMDGIIASTECLADAYSEFNDNVYLCPNSVDPDDGWDIERSESDVLRIGYYGSSSHTKDYPLVKKALKWAQRQKGVEVVMIGFAPPGWDGKILPWADNLYDARANLGHIDVGIAPLKVNPWSEGKSDVKALEYAMAGVMPIVQDSKPYSPWVNMGWEWCPRTERDWEEAIRDVVANRDVVETMAQEAKDYVLAERTIEKNIHTWREAVRG